MARRTDQIPADTKAWIKEGRSNIALWAERGLGIKLHSAQVEFAEAVLRGEAGYYLLTWANRAGKTTVLIVLHMHRLFYKLGVAPPESEAEEVMWKNEEYRTLHCAPLGELAGRAWLAIGDIINGTAKCQRDENGKRRPAPLAQMFAATKERTESNADRMFLRCLTGAVTDFRSTEGKAARIEGGAWRLITWDEWPSTENPDDIRYVLYNRLTARAADYDAAVVLTGTITAETEHIAKEFLGFAEDPQNEDWWGNTAARSLNPGTTAKSLERAERNLDREDYERSVLGIPGGVKGRMFPSWLLDPVFDPKLPAWQAPDKSPGEGGVARYTYLHVWDLAIAAADNVGMVIRVPFDWRFSVESPLVGVSLKIIPGSRTLIDDEIEFAIQETYLPYGGVIYVDSTDAHGKNIHRSLRRKGLPAHGFDFKEQEGNRITRKARGISALRSIFAEGIDPQRDSAGEPIHDIDGILAHDLGKPYGAMKLPASWAKPKDQLAILRPPPLDERQTKDAAMVVLMACEIAWRERRGRTRRHTVQQARFFARRTNLLSAGPRTLYAHPAD